jgi:HSP20 family protein
MTIVRLNPLFDLDREVETLNRLLDRKVVSRNRSAQADQDFSPAIELYATDSAFILRAEIPGIEIKDLEITVTAEQLTIRGRRQPATDLAGKATLHRELSYGRFQRTVRFPAKINNNAVEADYRDGLLTVTLPKREDKANRVVKVDVTQLGASPAAQSLAGDHSQAQ